MPFIKLLVRDIVFFALGIAFIAAPMAAYKLGVLPPLRAALGLDEKTSPFVSAPGMLLAMVLGYWAYVRFVERRAALELSLRPAQVLFGIALAVVLIGAPALLLFALDYYAPVSYQGSYAIWSVMPIILAAAVIEELVFRGLMFGILERRIGTVAALLVQSVIFAALHLSNAGFGGWIDLLAGILIGAMWTLLYIFWRNIWSISFHHAAWNLTIVFTGLPLSGLEDFRAAAPYRSAFNGPVLMTGGDAGPEASVVTLAVVAAALVVLFLTAWRRGVLRAPTPPAVQTAPSN